MLETNLRLVELNEDIKEDYLALKVLESQTTFVESPMTSLIDKNNHAWDIDWTIECIFKDEIMIGYAMHGIASDGIAWLDRFMIDSDYQGHGYGPIALKMILTKMHNVYKAYKHLALSVEKHNTKAIKLYESFGFYLTKEMDGIYPVMLLDDMKTQS